MRRCLLSLIPLMLIAASCSLGSSNADSPWTGVRASPLSARTASVVAWTGTEILVVGGNNAPPCPPGQDCVPPCPPEDNCDGTTGAAFTDGAAFDPVRNTWRSIADAPVAIRSGRAVSVEEQIVVIVESPFTEQVLLRYDVPSDSWATLDLPPAALEDRLLSTKTDQWASFPNIPGRDGKNVTRQVSTVGPYGFAFGGTNTNDSGSRGEVLGDAWILKPLASG